MDRFCRFCRTPLRKTFVDLNSSPLANSLLDEKGYNGMEARYPLHAFVCEQCFLVQLDAVVTADRIFADNYLYFSSYSDYWLAHCRAYCEAMTARFGLGKNSMVVEVASKDGGLLRNFVDAGIPVLGIEPAANVAAVANEKGVRTEAIFFGEQAAKKLKADGFSADLMAANNVLAHVPDINDFVEGFRVLLKPEGVVTFEFPHLLNLIEQNQFDTIYHEHYSYLSLLTVEKVLAAHALSVFDVEELPTHGGSLRVYGCHNGKRPAGERVIALRAKEKAEKLDRIEAYSAYTEQVVRTKCEVLAFFIEAKRAGKTVVGYGAPAKGNTLLNYCGIGPEFMPYTVDRSPHKQGRWLPGTRIPIRHPDEILNTRPDYIFILPWNIKDEIAGQMNAAREFGAKFVTAIPRLQVW
jgi:2-polyprenyl-3-methyl-5-hydroxy-6-metoxy-1,4-benzoquinol methylase